MCVAATTRWQGMISGIGLWPLACPTDRALPPALWRDILVAARLAIGDVAQRLPDPAPVCRCRQVPAADRTPSVRHQNRPCSCSRARSRTGETNLLGHPAPIQRDDSTVLLEDGDVAHRRMKRKLRHGCYSRLKGGCETGLKAGVKGRRQQDGSV